MKCVALVCCLAVLGSLGATAGFGLEWRVEAFVFATEKPQGPGLSRVGGRGVHRLLLETISIADTIFPIRSRLIAGELFWEFQRGDVCSTPWGFAAFGAIYHECRTEYIQNPCDDGIWSSFTTGRVSLHPQGGTKLMASVPKQVVCACN